MINLKIYTKILLNEFKLIFNDYNFRFYIFDT